MNKSTRRLFTVLAPVLAAAMMSAPAHARPTWDDEPVQVTAQVKPAPRIVDLRVGEHKRFDRVVIDVRGKIPGYRVHYVKQLRFDASGRVVPLQGKRFVAITLSPARAHGSKGKSTYDGPMLGDYGLPVLRGAAFTGDFEGRVSFGLALKRRADFGVSVLHHPQRIVIDLRHP